MGKIKTRVHNKRKIVIPYAKSKISVQSGEYIFYYPKGIKWGCKKCGACCQDASHRPRSVLLLPLDIKRLEDSGERDFFTEVSGKEPFIAEMRKKGGVCLYLTKGGCCIYPQRALLCRMYPLWVEREGRILEIRVDTRCPGFGHGAELKEEFYRNLLIKALEQMSEERSTS